jgi:hypothetical protein
MRINDGALKLILQKVTAAGPWDDESPQRRMHAAKPYFRMQRYPDGTRKVEAQL